MPYFANLLAETEIEHQPCAGESEREGEPDARQTAIEYESEQIARRQGDEEIGDEGNVHHWFDIGYSAQGVGVIALQAIAKLVDDERKDEACHHECHFVVLGKPSAHLVTEKEKWNGYGQTHQQNDVEAGTG